MAFWEQVDYPLVILAVAILLFLFGLAYLFIKNKQYSQDKPKDPLFRTIIIASFLIFILIIADVLNVGSFSLREHWWILIGIFIMVLWLNAYYLRKLNPLSYNKLKKIAIEFLESETGEKTFKGPTFGLPISLYRYTEASHKVGGLTDAVSNFLFFTNRRRRVLIKLDSFKGYQLELVPDPKIDVVEAIFKKDLIVIPNLERQELGQGFGIAGNSNPQQSNEEQQQQ